MKKSLFLLMITSLLLAACQNDKAPAAKTPVVPTEVTAAVAVSAEESKKAPPQAEQKQAVVAADSAVAVTKPVETNAGKSIQAALHKTGAELQANIEALTEKPVIADKPVLTKPVLAKPSVVEAAMVKKMPLNAVPAAAPAKAVVAATTRAMPKPVHKAALTPPPVIPTVPVAKLGDAAKGKSLARSKCKTCHNFTAKKKIGPGLKGIFGRKAGIMPGMRYSPALAAGGWVWDEKNMAAWVCDSQKALKTLSGNASAKSRMKAQNICDTGKQADLIAFLKTL